MVPPKAGHSKKRIWSIRLFRLRRICLRQKLYPIGFAKGGTLQVYSSMKKNTLLTTILLIFLLLGWPFLSYVVMQNAKDQIPQGLTSPATQLYLPTMIVEWLIFLWIFLVLKRGEEDLKSIGWKSLSWKNLLIGLLFLGFANIVLVGLGSLFHISVTKEIKYLLPKTFLDKLLWILMSLTAAICEETGFRGYVLTKLNSFLSNWWLTVLVSSLFFGLGHLYQGWGGTILTGIYGLLFSLLFIWRKSLIPGVLAHFLQDAIAMFYI